MNEVGDDELLMGLVEQALRLPEEERAEWLRGACGGDTELIALVRNYVDSELEMKSFLERPFACLQTPALQTVALDARFPDDPFEPEELVAGRFRITRRVAEGGMGVVYEATDERLRRRVAIKCAKPGFGNRLPPEVRHAREISHPGVCRIFDIHTALTVQGEIEFLSMEFLDGQTLAERLRGAPLAGPTARAIAIQLCEGLAEAHRNGVVHGDLKCNNIILAPADSPASERAVITDFGLARQPNTTGDCSKSALMASAPVGGERGYMAPELLKGARPSLASDVYAMGAILKELVSRAGSGVPGRWTGIIARCLNPDPARRFADGAALCQALRPPLARRWALGAAAAVLFAASVSGAVTWSRATAPRQTVRLALLPFRSDAGSADAAAKLSRETSAILTHLKGNAQTRVIFVDGKDLDAKDPVPHGDPVERARTVLSASHVLRGTLETDRPGTEKGSVVLHVFLADTQSGVNTTEWTTRYTPAELRYAPVAVGDTVTNSLHLPPMGPRATINAAAQRDYAVGMSEIRSDVRPDDAIHLMENAVAGDTDSALAYAGLAEAQAFKSRSSHDPVWQDKARESVRQAELRHPDLPEVHMISGWMERTSGHYEAAEKHFLRAIEIQPGNADAWRRLGQTYGTAGRKDEALSALKKAVQLDPGFRNHGELGKFYYRQNRYPEAAEEYGAMAKLAPNSQEAHFLLGQTFYQMGRYSDSESELRAALKIQETSAAEQALGAVFWDRRQDPEAVAHYLRALELGPETSSLWLSLSFCYVEEGIHGKAKDAFQNGLAASGKALAQDPRSGMEHATQAYFEAMLRDSARAETDVAEALKLSQDDRTIQLAVLTYVALERPGPALKLVEAFPAVTDELSRYPWLDALRNDPRFIKVLKSNHAQ